MRPIDFVEISVLFVELIVVLATFDIKLATALSSSKQTYGFKFRFTRYGDVDNCGKRKRNVENRKCFRQCQSDSDCKGSKRRCLCDGECGLSCVRITTSCSKVGEFKNGVVSYHPDNYFGGQIIYECNPGYSLIGDRVRICEGDGWWSGSSPVCQKEMYCEGIPQIPNAFPNVQVNNQSRYKTGTEIEYQCDIGYTSSSSSDLNNLAISNSNINNNNKVICLDDAKWSQTQFQCTKINCGRPDSIENGYINSNDFFYSSVIEYKCLPGYRIRNGDFLRECDLDGQWSGRKPTCEPVDCGEPTSIRNGLVSYNSTLLNSKAFYRCINEERLQLTGPTSEILCMPDGKWTSALPQCIHRNCTLNSTEYSKKVYNIFSSSQSLENYVYSVNTVIRVLCQPGYEIVGQTQLTCMNGPTGATQWNETPPTCRQEIYCPLVNPPEYSLINSNRQSTPSGYPLNTTLEFTCVQGYRLEGSRVHTCSESGTWRGDRVTCVPVTTTTPSTTTTTTTTTTKTLSTTRDENDDDDDDIDNRVVKTTLLPAATARSRYEACKIDTSSIIISYANSINTNLMQSVNDFVFQNATIGNFIEHGSTVSYYCKASSHILYTAKCINGTLLMEQNCNELTKTSNSPCSTPPKIPHGYNKYSSSLHGSKAYYQCFNGFELSKGDGELRCVDGEWVGAIPICSKVNCAYPGPLENGKIYYVGTLSEYTYQPYMSSVGQNKQIRYECDRDYKLVGPHGSTCINGNWKPSVRTVKCVRDDATSSAGGTLLVNSLVKPTAGAASAAAFNAGKIVLFNQKQSSTKNYLDNNQQETQVNGEKSSQLKRLKKHKSKRVKNYLPPLSSSSSPSPTDGSSAALVLTSSPTMRRRLRMKSQQQQQKQRVNGSETVTEKNPRVHTRRVHHEKKTYLNY